MVYERRKQNHILVCYQHYIYILDNRTPFCTSHAQLVLVQLLYQWIIMHQLWQCFRQGGKNNKRKSARKDSRWQISRWQSSLPGPGSGVGYTPHSCILVCCMQSSHTPPDTNPASSNTYGPRRHIDAWLLQLYSVRRQEGVSDDAVQLIVW